MAANSKQTTDRLIDDRELAELIGWKPDTPRVLRLRGRMPISFFKIGNRVRYRLSEVEAYIESTRVPASTPKNS